MAGFSGSRQSVVHIVEPDRAVRESLVDIVRLEGHQTFCYSRGGDFLARAPKSGGAVVCESQLPDISGIELFRTLGSEDVGWRFALLVSRNYAVMADLARRTGISVVLAKPLTDASALLDFLRLTEQAHRRRTGPRTRTP